MILGRGNGVGFDMIYDIGKLLCVYHRRHHTEEFEGTGIGLTTVVQRVIGQHGGRTRAEEQIDQGATFCF